MIIQVTQEHIDKAEALRDAGKLGSSNFCPIWQAVDEKMPCRPWRVRAKCIYVEGHVMYLPRIVQVFINSFDGRCAVAPFSFEFEWSK